jgi:RsiW-degrading membrane proteinase PrsW (M82 family)
MDALFLIGLALAPGAAIGLFIWLRDKYDREPLKHMFISFMLGVLCAIPAVILSIVLGMFIPVDYQNIFSVAIYALIVVAFAEEFAKFLILRFYAYRQKEFNEPFDGIVYGAIISLGFAGIENILYVMDGGMQVGIMRMFTAVPAHASFGIIMGYYFGLAWKHKDKARAYKLKGLLAAIFLHGLYNFFLMQESYPAFWFLSFVGLAISIRLCFKAMKAHSERSPFKDDKF